MSRPPFAASDRTRPGHASEVSLLLLILGLALALRLYHLEDVPYGFFCDEASVGYNAFSLLQTGRDEYGETFPVFFRSFGDYRHPIAIYSAIPFVAVFGLTERAVRLHAVFYGALTVLLLFLLGRAIRPGPTGLWAALVGATMPWLVHYNRTGFEFSAYAAFFTASVYLAFRAAASPRWIVPAFAAIGLTIYTYQPAKLLAPLLLVGFLTFYRGTLRKHPGRTVAGLLLFGLLSIPLAQSFLEGTATARFQLTSVLTAGLSPRDALLHVARNYLFQLTPGFLYWIGDPTPISRHFTRGLDPLLAVTLPWLALGFVATVQIRHRPASWLLLWWLLLYPVAGALVALAPFTSRSVIGAPLLALLTGLGIAASLEWLGARRAVRVVLALGVALGLLGNTALFFNYYLRDYPLESSGFWGWQYGPREIVPYFVVTEPEYDRQFLAPVFNAPAIFFAFYAPSGCPKCAIGHPDEDYDPRLRQLFAVPPEYLDGLGGRKFRIRRTVSYPDGSVAFYIGEVVPGS